MASRRRARLPDSGRRMSRCGTNSSSRRPRSRVAQSRRQTSREVGNRTACFQRFLLYRAMLFSHTIARVQEATETRGQDHVAFVVEAVLEREFDRPLTLVKISETLQLRPRQLAREFSKVFGVSPRRRLSAIRVGRAVQLLRCTEDKVEAVGYSVGFRSRASFYRAFKQITGHTPTQLRSDQTEKKSGVSSPEKCQLSSAPKTDQ